MFRILLEQFAAAAPMRPLSETKMKKILRFSKHPLFITLLGTLIGSAVIPWIVGRSNTEAALAKARVDQAIEMVNASNSVNVILSKMQTEFENFENDSLCGSPEDYRKRRDDLRYEIYRLHRDLNGVAWWWPWNNSYRASALKLISDKDSEQIKNIITSEYIKNIQDTCILLKGPWKKYIPDVSPTPGQPKEPIMPGLEKQL